jgi:hypothetical protein
MPSGLKLTVFTRRFEAAASLVKTYWEIGKRTVEHELEGSEKTGGVANGSRFGYLIH